jgi:hypothetical protein
MDAWSARGVPAKARGPAGPSNAEKHPASQMRDRGGTRADARCWSGQPVRSGSGRSAGGLAPNPIPGAGPLPFGPRAGDQSAALRRIYLPSHPLSDSAARERRKHFPSVTARGTLVNRRAPSGKSRRGWGITFYVCKFRIAGADDCCRPEAARLCDFALS